MKNFKLAFTDNTTFYGVDAEGFYAAALLKGVSKESFRLVPNVKSKIKLAKLNLGNIIQDDSCSFNGTGEGTLSQKTFTAADAKLNLSYCSTTFESDYLSQLMRPGSNTGQVMPASVEEFLLTEVSKKVSNDLEYIVWQGSGATNSSNFTSVLGLQAKLLADSDVIDVSAVTLTSANIIAQISRVYDAIPTAIRDAEDLVIYMGTKAAAFYRQALAAASSEMYYMQNHTELQFLGVKIIVAGGMSDNRMVAAQRSNILLLTDLVSDFEEVKVLPQYNVTGEPVVRMVGRFKFDVDFLYGAEIVYYN